MQTDELNLEIEAILDALAVLCYNSLRGFPSDLSERSDKLLKTLLMSGFHSTKHSLGSEIEKRVKALYPTPYRPDGASLLALTSELVATFKNLERFESSYPD